jgi:diguanylate cyclase
MVSTKKGSDDHERTIVFGEQAIGHIKTYRTSAYPRIYELWYTFATGHNAPLNKAISSALGRNDGISEQEIEEIYDNYLSPLRFSDRVDQVGSRLMGEIDQVMAMVEAAMDQTSGYGEELRGAVDGLSVPDTTRDNIKAILESVVRVASEMELSNKILQDRLRESKAEIRSLQEDLVAVRTESLTDPLTSLANRKAFDGALAAAVASAQASQEPLTLLITDIDHFKRFNDSFGHLTGDQVLRLVALSVKQNVKGADLASRFGGEEFAVILPNTPLRSGLTVAEHIRRAVMSKELVKRSTGENLGRITISIGVAAFRRGDSPASLIERADGCLYAAKRGGRNRVVCETDPDYELDAAAVA